MQRKIFTYFAVVLLISLTISGFITTSVVKDIFNRDVEDKLISEANIIKEMLADNINENDDKGMQSALHRISANTNTRITIIDTSGKVIAETSYDANLMENHLKRPEVQQALTGKVGRQKRFSTTMQVDFLYIAQPIYKDGKIAAVVRLATPLEELNNISKSISLSTFGALAPGLILALLLAYTFAVNITMPIRKIKDAAAEITKGRLDTKISIIDKDELGELAKSIDFMASSLKDKINSINDKNTKMEAILSSVINGIIAVDTNNRILFINPMAIKMLDIREEEVSGKHLLRVIRNNKIDNLIRSVLENKSFTDTELSLNYPEEKIYKLFTNPIKYPDSERIIGIIIILQDITEIRKLEGMRSEFVANVTHELKTPLTSIKGFVETLKNGAVEDPDTSMRFLNIIEDEADRLHRLISDILSLSELESRKVKLNEEKIDTRKVLSEVVSMLQNQAEAKHIALTDKISAEVYDLKGESDKLKQMLINLVDNAIKYTPENGKVDVSAYNEGNNVLIKIKDNGIGISKEHIPRLFERFYRIDKARSRKVGGTGLGLAIVKHIVMQFEGKIEVNSEEGKGTEFTVTIPIKA